MKQEKAKIQLIGRAEAMLRLGIMQPEFDKLSKDGKITMSGFSNEELGELYLSDVIEDVRKEQEEARIDANNNISLESRVAILEHDIKIIQLNYNRLGSNIKKVRKEKYDYSYLIPEGYLTIKQVADILDIGETQIDYLQKKQVIKPYFAKGRRLRLYDKETFDKVKEYFRMKEQTAR